MRSEGTAARAPRALKAVLPTILLIGAAAAFTRAPQQAAPVPDTSSLAAVLARLGGSDIPQLPAASQFTSGEITVPSGTRVAGPLAASNGSVHVFGTVTGDVIAYRGDVVVHEKGEVTGNAISIGGAVRVEGGHVAGQTLTLGGDVPGPGAGQAIPPANRTMHQLALVGGWIAIILIISVGVLVLATDNLSAVADALERHYGSSLVAGIAGQVAFAPLLVAILVALILSVLGILLVPFAAVAYVIVAAGLVTLGFLATAVVVGRGWRPAPPGSDRAKRAATLRALIVGVLVLLSPWLVAALLASWPTAEVLARGVAFAVTWVACTAGLGAALISRAGIKRAQSHQAQSALASPSWQTPTPVAGVVAARRPATTPTSGAR